MFKERRRFGSSIKNLFEEKLIPLLTEHSPKDNSNGEWKHFEAAIMKAAHQMQKMIRKKLGLKEKGDRKRGSQNRKSNEESSTRESLFELDRQEKLSCTLAGKLRQLHELFTQERTQARANLIACLEGEALGIAQKIDARIIQGTLGEVSIDAIRRLIQEVNVEERERRLDWCHYFLLEEETKQRKQWNLKKAKQNQELYSEDLSRAFRWITADASPECSLQMKEVEEFFKNRWTQIPDYTAPESDSAWSLPSSVDSEERNRIESDLQDQTLIGCR